MQTGLHQANIVRDDATDGGGYPPETEQVFVAPTTGRSGYCNVYMLDAHGDIVASIERPAHRVAGALSGPRGYDVVLRR